MRGESLITSYHKNATLVMSKKTPVQKKQAVHRSGLLCGVIPGLVLFEVYALFQVCVPAVHLAARDSFAFHAF